MLAKLLKTMDNVHHTQEELSNLIVTEQMRANIYDMTKWAGFLAVIGFIISGIWIIAALTLGPAVNHTFLLTSKLNSFLIPTKLVVTGVNLIFAFAVFYPSLLLFKFANRGKYAVLNGEQQSFDEAFSKLRSLMKYWGIITIILIGLYLLLFVAAIGLSWQ